MFGVPSGLRAGLNAAAFAFAHGRKSRETGGHPAIGVFRGPPPSWAVRIAPVIHESATAAASTSDRRINMFVTPVWLGGPEGPPLQSSGYSRPAKAPETYICPIDREAALHVRLASAFAEAALHVRLASAIVEADLQVRL